MDKHVATNVNLGDAHFKHVATVEGGDKGYLVFGIGGHANYHVAMNQLREQAEMGKGPRALVNVTEDVQTTYFPFIFLPFVIQQSLTLSADVVEFSR